MNQLETENLDILIPVSFNMLRKASRRNEILRNYLLEYCNKFRIAVGFSSYKIIFTDEPVLTPEEIAENKPVLT